MAGLPNAMGGYDDTPADMARDNEIFLKDGLVNMIGRTHHHHPLMDRLTGLLLLLLLLLL